MFRFTYQGISSEGRCEVVERPPIQTPKRRVETITVPGRNGSLHISDGTYEELKIPVRINYKVGEESEFYEKGAAIKSWLLGGISGEILSFSDQLGEFYKVNYVELSQIERENKVVGKLTATFVCEPFVYTQEGQEEKTIATGQFFPTSYPSEPLYVLGISSDTAEIKLEGKDTVKIEGYAGETITIDTALGVAYDDDGNNAVINGDINELKFDKGVNNFNIVKGFTGTVTPRWRHL